MQLSKKMLKISPSGTVILAQKARQLKAEVKILLNLGKENQILILQNLSLNTPINLQKMVLQNTLQYRVPQN